MTGQKAIEGCKRQDRICQKYIFDKYSDGMLMLCMRYVKHLQDAEELMLNGFFNFYKTIDRFVYSGDGSLVAWLKKIMVNECLMFLRKSNPDSFREKAGDENGVAETGIDAGINEQMSAAEIFKVITTLPDGYRTVFNLFAIEGYSHKEIAELLNISEGTSKSQLNKARAMLQKKILS
jgi:RNA polymerase sigma-70 factor (ECF subfamily)